VIASDGIASATASNEAVCTEARRGTKRAAVAVAHSVLVWAYWMLLHDEPCRDLGPHWLAKRKEAAHTRRLAAQLERLGHTVTLDAARPNPARPGPTLSAHLYSRVGVALSGLFPRAMAGGVRGSGAQPGTGSGEPSSGCRTAAGLASPKRTT
jgi:hypothetical protein